MATRVDHVRDELKALRAYGRLGRAKARLGEANTLTSDDSLMTLGEATCCWPSARGGSGGRVWRDASRPLIYRRSGSSAVRRGAAGASVGALLDKRHELPVGRPVAARRRRQGARRRGTTSRACPRSSPRRRRPSICSQRPLHPHGRDEVVKEVILRRS